MKVLLIGKSIVLLIGLALGGLGTYAYTTFDNIGDRIDSHLPIYQDARTAWIGRSETVFTEVNSNNPKAKLPSVAETNQIRKEVSTLVNALNSVPTPTDAISDAAAKFRMQLYDIVREIGRYDGSPEAFTKIVVASQDAAIVGRAYENTVEEYMGSTVKRLVGAIL